MENTEKNVSQIDLSPGGKSTALTAETEPLTIFWDTTPVPDQKIEKAATTPSDSPATILLSDNDDNLRQATTSLLETMDHIVVSCNNAHFAYEAFRAGGAIDLLLTDLQMPDNSGMELARELTECHPTLPVIVVSADLPRMEVRREMRFRQWKFLKKPLDPAKLLETVDALLRQRKQMSVRPFGTLQSR